MAETKTNPAKAATPNDPANSMNPLSGAPEAGENAVREERTIVERREANKASRPAGTSSVRSATGSRAGVVRTSAKPRSTNGSKDIASGKLSTLADDMNEMQNPSVDISAPTYNENVRESFPASGGGAAAPASSGGILSGLTSSSNTVKLLIVGAVVAGGIWYYRTQNKKGKKS